MHVDADTFLGSNWILNALPDRTTDIEFDSQSIEPNHRK